MNGAELNGLIPSVFAITEAGRKPNSRFSIEIGSYDEPIALQRQCMGVDWPMRLRELSEAIPPAYTEWIGNQFAVIADRAAVA